MKIMKSIIASLLSAALLFAGTSAFGVVAEGDMNLTVGSGSTTYDSSALDYPVITIPVASDVTLDGVAGIAFTVSFDPTELSVTASSDYFTDFETQFSGTTAPTSVSVGGVLYTSPIVSNNITSGTTRQGLAVAAALADPADPSSAYELLSLDVSLVAGNPPGDYGITIVPTLIDNADAGWDSEESNLVIGVSGTSDFSTILAASGYGDYITGGTVTFSITDTEPDGMDDGWEEYWHGQSGVTIPFSLGILDNGNDYDEDGVNDEDEFLAGTNPMQISGLTTELLFETFNNGGVQDKPWDGTGVDNVWTTDGTSIEVKDNRVEMKNWASCTIDLDTSGYSTVTISIDVIQSGTDWYVSFGGTDILTEADGTGTHALSFDSNSNPEMFASDATLELSAFDKTVFDNASIVAEGSGGPVPVTLSSIDVTADDTDLTDGEAANLTTDATYSDASAVADVAATYSILSGGSAGTLNESVFTAGSVGTATDVTIQASFTDGSVTETDTVVITVNPVPVTLSSIDVTADDTTLTEGGAATLTTDATYSDASTVADVAATYSILSGGSAGTLNGSVFTAGSVGTATDVTIQASFTDSGVTATDTVVITVNPVTLSDIHANPASNVIDSEGSTDLLVLAEFSSGATSDVTTDEATTYSVDPSSAGSATSGTFAASSVTSTVIATITVSYTYSGVTETETMNITISPASATLTSIDVTADDTTISANKSTNLTVIATLSDSTTPDVTIDTDTTYTVDPSSAGSVDITGLFTASGVTEEVIATITVSYTLSGATATDTVDISITAEGNGSSESGCFIGTISGLSSNLTHLFTLGLSSSVCLMIRRKKR